MKVKFFKTDFYIGPDNTNSTFRTGRLNHSFFNQPYTVNVRFSSWRITGNYADKFRQYLEDIE